LRSELHRYDSTESFIFSVQVYPHKSQKFVAEGQLMINKLLIANRGEIACRIIDSAKKSGIQTVAVFSDADRHSLHAQKADESYHIGPAPALESYLNQESVLAIAQQASVDAIHPGYGFLSENAEFAERCAQEGITFIGPPASAITKMGSKSAARVIMEAAGVPVLKGLQGQDLESGNIAELVANIGYPVLLKPAAGGGGKGMKIVDAPDALADAIASARREAMSAFGSDELIIERYLERTRHIEIQVFADQHGNCIHLLERDCSLQRRHQKVIEEAPAPGISESLRAKLGQAAVDAAKSVDYVGAGTVEFLLGEDEQFYFMEMNTRLQVEHPVTELITGIDLVAWQLQIANGDKLPLKQDEVRLQGHAIEARIYAEDPGQDFLPASGRVSYLGLPQSSPHVRVDNGIIQGEHIGVYYDPMLMKVISWNNDRLSAVQSLSGALENLHVAGLKTNRDYLKAVLDHPHYQSAELHTLFLDQHQTDLCKPITTRTWKEIIATACQALLENSESGERAVGETHPNSSGPANSSPWSTEHCLRLNLPAKSSIYLRSQYGLIRVETLRQAGRDQITFTVPDGEEVNATVDESALESTNTYLTTEQITVFHPQVTITMERPHAGMVGHTEEEGQVLSPMAGRIISVAVSEGQQVEPGDTLVIIEAMKMEHTLLARESGIVTKIPYQEGELVNEGVELVEIQAHIETD
jgi:3-methylcrotonyl-CoA carboxylase alpha subunit